MTAESLYQLFGGLLLANLIAMVVLWQVMPRRGATRRERKRFLNYMRQLDAEEAGRETLRQFGSHKELRKANDRLKKILNM